MRERMQALIAKIDKWVFWADRLPLWWVGFLLTGIVMLPICALGEGSVFTIIDQWDDTLMYYVLTARHPGADVIPEMLGGLNASGMQPAAALFVLLYRVMPPFSAFLCSYVIMVLLGFLGMYLAVRELTGSGILALFSAGVFCMLPLYPVFGLSEAGVPLVLFAYLRLRGKRNRIPALLICLLFGLTSHLVYTGYVVLFFWGIAMAVDLVKKRDPAKLLGWEGAGFLLLLATYLVINADLFREVLFGKGNFVSHREEMVNAALPFWETVKNVFLESAQHAPSYHKWLIVPLLILLVLEGIFYPRLNRSARICYLEALGLMAALASIALFYAFCKSQPVVDWKNSVSGFLHYFQIDRFYWLYPSGWYLEFALVFGVWRRQAGQGSGEQARMDGGEQGSGELTRTDSGKQGSGEPTRTYDGRLPGGILLPVLCAALVLYPTANTVLHESYFYMNVNQYNNGSGITGYISWEAMYPEELMQEIEDAIGRDMDTYRIGNLGISPAPALMHGFYTIDGYSNNYPLDYKHAFRRAMAAELAKAEETAIYFDTWGSRCYLFNSLTGNYWLISKDSGIRFEGLEFDLEALGELGCEYLFSGAQIVDAEDMGLDFMGYFETEKSYWGIWLYAL